MQANRNASATADVTPRNSCDYCGAEGGVPPSDLGLQEIDNSTFCSVHAADWRGFHEGCRVMALSNVGAAVVEALRGGGDAGASRSVRPDRPQRRTPPRFGAGRDRWRQWRARPLTCATART